MSVSVLAFVLAALMQQEGYVAELYSTKAECEEARVEAVKDIDVILLSPCQTVELPKK